MECQSRLRDAYCLANAGRPQRSYKIGTTIMFSAVEPRSPDMMTPEHDDHRHRRLNLTAWFASGRDKRP
jgi:hypothetical protein